MNKWCWRLCLSVVATMLLLLHSCTPHPQQKSAALYSTDSFSIYADSVVQGGYVAFAPDGATIVSRYASVAENHLEWPFKFKFCFNGRDNEFASRQSWHYSLPKGSDTTMICRPGSADEMPKVKRRAINDLRHTIQLDMRPVLKALGEKGVYVTASGDSIFAHNLNGVWLSSPQLPGSEHYLSLHSRKDLQLKDRGDSIYEVTINFPSAASFYFDGGGVVCDTIPTGYPAYTSRHNLETAISNIALCRLDSIVSHIIALPSDSISTIDVSYAVAMSLAIVNPEISKKLLMKCVVDGRVKQNIKEYGAWPFTSDRYMWIVAAYEVYKSTGDMKWLKDIYRIAKDIIDTDIEVVYNRNIDLIAGQPPRDGWFVRGVPTCIMPVEIYQSFSARTNIEFVMAMRVMQSLGRELGLDYDMPIAYDKLTDNYNFRFWLPLFNRYSAFLYNAPFYTQCDATDNLAQAMAVLSGVASSDIAATIVKHTPSSPFGMMSFYPSIPGAKSANAVYPWVQVIWTLASAQAGNLSSIVNSIASFYRNVSFSLVEGLPVDAADGAFRSGDRWSALLTTCAVEALNLRLYGGISLQDSLMKFSPSIPHQFKAERHISALKYGKSTLDIYISGTGSRIASFMVDTVEMLKPEVPRSLTGHHVVRIVMSSKGYPESKSTISQATSLPASPEVRCLKNILYISNFNEKSNYCLMANGVKIDDVNQRELALPDASGYEEYSIVMESKNGASLASNIIKKYSRGSMSRIYASAIGHCGTSLPVSDDRREQVLELSPARNLNLEFNVKCSETARYILSMRYANGSGEEDAQSRCVIRTLKVNGKKVGTIVMPCIGAGNWQNMAFTNAIIIDLRRGDNKISLQFDSPCDFNAARSQGTALIQYVQFLKL